MKVRNLLAEISRAFLKELGILRCRLKKVSDMNDNQVISVCHGIVEGNRLHGEWKEFREAYEAQYNYCSYLSEYIEYSVCSMLQTGFSNEERIDEEKLKACCSECKYQL